MYYKIAKILTKTNFKMNKEKKKSHLNYIINECEAQIEVNKMIIEDYKNDIDFCNGLKNQINEWNKKIVFCQNKLLELF